MSNVLTSLRTGLACCEKMIFMRHVVCNLTSINFKDLKNEYIFFPPSISLISKLWLWTVFSHGNAISVNIMLCPLSLFLSYSNQIFLPISLSLVLYLRLWVLFPHSSYLQFGVSIFPVQFIRILTFFYFPHFYFFGFILFLLSPVLLQSPLFSLASKASFHP